MNIKKLLLISLATSSLLFTSCSDKDEPVNNEERTGEIMVICNGQFNNSIPGSITLYDPETDVATLSAFAKTNGRHIGTSVESAIQTPEGLFIISTLENRIELVDEHNLKAKSSIDMIQLFQDKGAQPRYAAYFHGYIYVTTYAGYICPINTKTLSGGTPIQVGSYPEDISISLSADGKIVYAWVANSDYGNQNASISMVNLYTGTVENITAPQIKNPSKIISSPSTLWILDRGSYDENWNQVGSALYKYNIATKSFTKLADATMISNVDNNSVVICNAPWQTPPVVPSYSLVNLLTDEISPLTDVSVDYPAFLGLDFATGGIYIGSNSVNPETGYANFNSNGYVRIFNLKGETINTFECGVGPMDIVFVKK